MTNTELLDKLMTRSNDANAEKFDDQSRTYNAQVVRKYLLNLDPAESAFPINEVKKYIRLNEWQLADFDTHTELIIQKTLPKWFHIIFLKMKQFRMNTRDELSSREDAFARIMGYPTNTQDEKAFVIYNYLLQEYINRV